MSAFTRILDSIFAGSFKTDAAGRTIFYPSGAMGPGYIVPDKAREERIRAYLRWYFIAVVAFAGLVSPLVVRVIEGMETTTAIIVAVVAIAAFSGLGWAVSRSFAAGLEQSEERQTFAEAFRSQAAAEPKWMAGLMVGMMGLLTLGGVLMIRDAVTTGQMIGAYAATVVCALLLVASVWTYVLKSRSSTHQG